MKKLGLATVAAMMVGAPVMADLVFPSLSYRTGPYAAGGIPFADGYADYMTLLNERDGGIGGVPARILECETGYNTEKGVECYEATKGEGSLVYQPLSTGITYQLIPKATADGIPIHSMGYGRTSAKNGDVFSNVFNYGQEQKSQWLQIRRERPDFVLMWGWGVMNQVAVQEAANIRFNMENFIGIWWSGSENDVLPAGDAANGYKALTFHGVGSDFPIFEDIQKYVLDAGKAAGAGDQVGSVLYNRGLYAAMLAAEAAKEAQEIHGVAEITAAQMRDGMEALEISEAKMADLGLPNFGPSFAVSCSNHGGDALVGVTQWDASAKTWSLISDFKATDGDVIGPLIDEDSKAYAAENGIEGRC